MSITVGMNIHCPKCSSKRCWLLKDGRYRCSVCRKTFTDPRKLIRISRSVLQTVLQEFLLEHLTNIMLGRINISKYTLLKILTLLRMAMTKDVPQVFEGTIEVDETQLGGQWKNKRLSVKRANKSSGRGRGKSKQAVFGILCRNGKVWA